MNIVTFPDKSQSEVIPLSVNFSDKLQFGETITGSTVTAFVFSGIDSSPSNIFLGASTHLGSSISQDITGGVPGVLYSLVFTASASSGHIYTKIGRLAVVSDSNQY